MDNDMTYLEDELDAFPQEVRIMPFNIQPEYMLEFQQFLDELKDEIAEDNLIEHSLWEETDDKAFKKRIVLTATIGSVASFRYMEKMVTELPEAAEDWQKAWAEMGLLHAQMFMEQNLMDDPVGFIVSGLGGEQSLIRYCIAVRTDRPVTAHMASYVHAEFSDYLQSKDSKIEAKYTFGPNYVCMTALIHYKKTPIPLIESAIEQLNFLDKDHMTSNMHIFTEEELLSWLDK